MCQTLYVVQYTKQMGNKPAVFQQNVMCVQISTAIISVCYTHISPFHGHNTTAVLTGHGATACNLIFELSAAVLAISEQQTKTGNIVAQTCKMLPWTSSTHYIVCVSVFLP